MGLTSYPRPVVVNSLPSQPAHQQSTPERPTPVQKDNLEYKRSKIKQLFEKGLITEKAYNMKRKQILDEL